MSQALNVSGSWPSLNSSQVHLFAYQLCLTQRETMPSVGALWTRLLFRSKRWTATKSKNNAGCKLIFWKEPESCLVAWRLCASVNKLSSREHGELGSRR